MRLVSIALASLFVGCLSACAGNASTQSGVGGGGGAGGDAADGSGGSHGSTTSADPSTGSGSLQDQLQAACTEGCAKVDELSQDLGCAPTPNCVQDCVAYGASLGDCEDEDVTLAQCAAVQMSAQTCSCAPSYGNILGCDLCPNELAALQACTGM